MSSSTIRRSRALPSAARDGARLSNRRERRSPLPDLPIDHVSRSSLFALFDGLLSKTLLLVSAPPGAGKTTLLVEWCRAREDSFDIHWIALGENDADQVLSRVPLGTAGPTLIVIDNAHLITARHTLQRLRDHVLASPHERRWILCGRGTPDINVDLFAMHDRLLRFDAEELRVDAAFVAQLARARSLTVTRDRTEQLCATTDGWLAGIKLSLLAEDAHSDTTFYDYFANVLFDYPRQVRRYLLACSIVECFDESLAMELAAVLADAAVGVSPLDVLLRAQLFVRRVAGNEHCLQRNFLAFLRHCASHELVAELPALHCRASRWYAAQKRYEEALRHAFDGGDPNWRLDLLALAARHLLKTGAIDQALKWTTRLSRAELFAREALWTAHVAALILARRFAPAQSTLREALDRHAAGTLGGEHIDNKLRTLQLMLSLLSDGSAAIEPPAESKEHHDAYLTGTLLSLQAYWLLQAQSFEAARRRAQQARELLLNQGSYYGATQAGSILSGVLGMLGHSRAAARECEAMFQIVSHGPHNIAWASAAISLAQVRYEQNRLAEAEALCNQSLPLLAAASTLQTFAIGNVLMSRILAATARIREAWQVVDDLHGYLETHHTPHLLAQVGYEKTRLAVHHPAFSLQTVAREFRLDELEADDAWRSCRVDKAASAHESMQRDNAVAQLGVAQALRLLHLDEHRRCAAIVATLSEQAARVGFAQRLLHLEALLAVSRARNVEDSTAFAALNRALEHADGVGFTRGVLDDVPGLGALLSVAAQRGAIRHELPANYFENYGACFAGGHATSRVFARRIERTQRLLAPERLTDRERDVLHLLAQGYSNQEICEHSNIAITTAKWHLKNIFSKLNVNTRTAALARARTLQLID